MLTASLYERNIHIENFFEHPSPGFPENVLGVRLHFVKLCHSISPSSECGFGQVNDKLFQHPCVMFCSGWTHCFYLLLWSVLVRNLNILQIRPLLLFLQNHLSLLHDLLLRDVKSVLVESHSQMVSISSNNQISNSWLKPSIKLMNDISPSAKIRKDLFTHHVSDNFASHHFLFSSCYCFCSFVLWSILLNHHIHIRIEGVSHN